MASKERRTPADSAVETTHAVLPPHTNHHGTAFGGIIMEWMDIAAGIAAGRHCRGQVVTAAVDDLTFARPIRLGDVVVIRCCVNYTGRTSMEVGVRVEREVAQSGAREHCLTGYFTFVAVDAHGSPIPVQPLTAVTPNDARRWAAARLRREQRLARRAAAVAGVSAAPSLGTKSKPRRKSR
jgi:acyl-CoA hydrolase